MRAGAHASTRTTQLYAAVMNDILLQLLRSESGAPEPSLALQRREDQYYGVGLKCLRKQTAFVARQSRRTLAYDDAVKFARPSLAC